MEALAGLRVRFTLAIAIILCLALASVAWVARKETSAVLTPVIQAKAETIARSAAALIQRGHSLGMPIEKMVGVAAYFAEIRAKNREFALIRLVAANGSELARAGAGVEGGTPDAVRVPVSDSRGKALAEVAITIDPAFVSNSVKAVLLDVAVLGLVFLLIALELIALVLGARGIQALGSIEERLRCLASGRLSMHKSCAGTVAQPLVQRFDELIANITTRFQNARSQTASSHQAPALFAEAEWKTGLGQIHSGENRKAVAVRISLFLFMMAEELTRPFLPRFSQALAPGDGIVGPGLAASLPLICFMAVFALCQVPFAGYSERLGRRRGFMIGAFLGVVSYLLAAWVQDYYLFLATRIFSAIGYALVFVSAQGHVIDHSHGAERNQALGMFIRTIMVACLCGPPIGGVIADRVGMEAAFVASAGLALAAMLVAAITLPRHKPKSMTASVIWSDVQAAVKTPGLLALLLGCSFPAKFVFAAIAFLLVPLELDRQGFSTAEIGRFQTIYPIIMVLGVSFFAALASRLGKQAEFVVAGGILSTAGALVAMLNPSLITIGVLLVMLGIGQSMAIASQSALVVETATRVGGQRFAGAVGLFRVVERIGNAAGPAAAGMLFAGFGFPVAIAVVGLIGAAGPLAYGMSGHKAVISGARSVPRDKALEGS